MTREFRKLIVKETHGKTDLRWQLPTSAAVMTEIAIPQVTMPKSHWQRDKLRERDKFTVGQDRFSPPLQGLHWTTHGLSGRISETSCLNSGHRLCRVYTISQLGSNAVTCSVINSSPGLTFSSEKNTMVSKKDDYMQERYIAQATQLRAIPATLETSRPHSSSLLTAAVVLLAER